MTTDKKMNTGGWGYLKVVTPLFPYSCSKTEKDLYLHQTKKIIENMKEHKTELLQIAGYILVIAGHLTLISYFSFLLNKSLNLI